MIRYRHPKHGYHIVGFGDDPAAFEAAGWVRDEPTPQAAPETAPAPAPKPTPAPAAPRREWRPKGGR